MPLKSNLIQRQYRLKMHSMLANPLRLYGCKIWILKQREDIWILKTVEMKFMRRTAGYSLLDQRRNEDILEELKVDLVEKK